MGTHKPNKCYYKPNRTRARVFTEADAARIFCQAKADSGATEDGFIARCKCWEGDSECERLKAEVKAAQAILLAILAALLLPESVVVRALMIMARFIPQRWLARLGITKLLQELPIVRAELERVIEMLRIP